MAAARPTDSPARAANTSKPSAVLPTQTRLRLGTNTPVPTMPFSRLAASRIAGRLLRLPVVPLLVALILAACHQNDDKPRPAAAPLPQDEIQLPPDSSKRGYIREQPVVLGAAPVMEPVAGKIAYDETRTARISSPITGRVVSGIPALGAGVKAQQPLMELDSPELGQAKEDYANALADQRLAEEAWRRAKMLYEGEVLPRKELQQAEDSVTRARNEVQRTKLHLHNLGVADDQINNRYVVRSPIAGTLTERHVNPGMQVRPDLPEPLFVVSDLRSLWVLMNVFEKDLGLIRPGKKVRVSVPAYPDRKFPATVEYIDKVVDEATRTVKVRATVDNADGALLPAMYASVEVESDAANRAIVVPLSALFTEGEGDQVFVAIGDGHYKRRDVKVGLRLKDKAVIAEGLKPGETIVSQGALMLRTEEANEEEAEP
jgi:cobalt-zinc-cadmium efflux system membrane fusion protein